MRLQIRLETGNDVIDFVTAVSTVDIPVYLKNGAEQCVSAQSMLGAMLSWREWNTTYVECEQDISGKISRWII